MERREFTAAVLVAALPGRVAAAAETDAAAGVRSLLERAAVAAVALLGHRDGFLGNAEVRIGLPGVLRDAERVLRRVGLARPLDELLTAMNRAAEDAVPQARSLFVDTVRTLAVDDALRLVRGGPTAVTDFFAARTREPLAGRFEPIVARATARLQLAGRYNALAAKAGALGLARGEPPTVEQHVTTQALNGLFLMLAQQERQVRADPLKAGSALLQRVFGR